MQASCERELSQWDVIVEVLAPGVRPFLRQHCHCKVNSVPPSPFSLSVSAQGSYHGFQLSFHWQLERSYLGVYSHRLLPFVKCLFNFPVHSFIKFSFWILGSFILICEIMNSLWNLWIIKVFLHIRALHCLMVFSGKNKEAIILTVGCSHVWLGDRMFWGVRSVFTQNKRRHSFFSNISGMI